MLRFLYRGVVGLHPSAFRNRFGEEMLSIFDSAKSNRAAIALLVDGIVSLGRQRLGEHQFSSESVSALGTPTGVSSVPSFVTLDSFHPQTSAILDGLVLSVALFCLTCFAIRYSWIRVLHVRIPEVQVEPYSATHSSAVARREAKRSGEAKNRETEATPAQDDEVSPHLQVELLPVEPGTAASAFEATTASSGETSNSQVQPLRAPGTVHLDLHVYEGIYVCPSPHFTISVTTEDGNLAVKIDGQRRRSMSAVSATTFVIEGTDDRIEFDQDGDGVIHQLRLRRRDRQYTAERQ
jgi:hypothetical protein